jgi:hypothetical protein
MAQYNLTGDFYLVVKKKQGWGSKLCGRLSLKNPALKSGEVAIKVNVVVPEALFVKPQLEAKVIIPESAVSKPVIDATVLDNVREIMEQQTGLDVSVRLVENEVQQ